MEVRGSRWEGEGSGTQAVKPPRGEGCRARPPARPAEVRLGQRFAQVRKGAASGSPQRALLGPVSSAASARPAPFNGLPSRGLPSAWSPSPLSQAGSLTGTPQSSLSQRAHLNGRRRRAATGLRAGGSGGGRSPRPGGRGHGRGGGGGPGGQRRERARGRPSPLAAACGQRRGGDSEAGPVTGAGPGEAGDAPRAPPPPPRGLPRPRPSGRRRRLLLLLPLLLRRPRDQRHRSPPPSRPGPARRAPRYLGQAGARPGLWEPEECMAGGRRRRRPRRRGLPAPGPGGRRGDSVPRARRLRAPGLAGRGGGRRKRRRPRAPSNEGAARPPAGPPAGPLARSTDPLVRRAGLSGPPGLGPELAEPRSRTNAARTEGQERAGPPAKPAHRPPWTPSQPNGPRCIVESPSLPGLARALLFIPQETRLRSGLFV